LVAFCFFSFDGLIVFVVGNGCPLDLVLYLCLRSVVETLTECIAKWCVDLLLKCYTSVWMTESDTCWKSWFFADCANYVMVPEVP
jgi:hypothetical protein